MNLGGANKIKKIYPLVSGMSMLRVQCMRLWYIMLVLNIAPKLSERFTCTDFLYMFIQMDWIVRVLVAHKIRLVFCEHRIHIHNKIRLFYIYVFFCLFYIYVFFLTSLFLQPE